MSKKYIMFRIFCPAFSHHWFPRKDDPFVHINGTPCTLDNFCAQVWGGKRFAVNLKGQRGH